MSKINNDKMTPIPQNYRKNIEWINQAYLDAGVTFPNGFQKDAIQNAVGARKSKKNWKGWSCDISLIENDKGTFLVIEDFGTVGLTGDNIPADTVNSMMANDEHLGPEQRLARFSSMFNSGGNTAGGGLYGAGKSVYSVASDEMLYYYDSLREDGKYVANLNNAGQVRSIAYEDQEAKQFIFDETGLLEKKTFGTRVIVRSPREELVSSIKDGSIEFFIQESWWRIMERLKYGSAISINGKAVAIPAGIREAKKKYELPKPEDYSKEYRVKQFGLYLFPDGGNLWNGISYYRKGMKIGEIELKNLPEKVKNKFWGFIEVDEEWEEELADIEDAVHFGVSKGKKNFKAYQYLKNYVDSKVKALLTEWGYIKDKEKENQKLMKELNEMAEKFQKLFDTMGYEDLGKGSKKSNFDIRLHSVVYPHKDTETVTAGDSIAFNVRLTSRYVSEKKFELTLKTVKPSTRETISVLNKETVSVPSEQTRVFPFKVDITLENSIQYAENELVVSVKPSSSGKEKIRELPYYFDIERSKSTRENVNLVLHHADMPHTDSRRVDFGESIKNISYLITNRRNHRLQWKLNVSVHNASDSTLPKLFDVASLTGSTDPMEETVTEVIKQIDFPEDKLKDYLEKGDLELRARLIANEDDDQYEKGDRITYYYWKFFLNQDEKNGKRDAFRVISVEDPSDYRRSWNTPGADRTITINIGHLAYLQRSDDADEQHRYLEEQMLKQYAGLYLAEGSYEIFGSDFTKLEPQEAAVRFSETVEKIYAKSLE